MNWHGFFCWSKLKKSTSIPISIYRSENIQNLCVFILRAWTLNITSIFFYVWLRMRNEYGICCHVKCVPVCLYVWSRLAWEHIKYYINNNLLFFFIKIRVCTNWSIFFSFLSFYFYENANKTKIQILSIKKARRCHLTSHFPNHQFCAVGFGQKWSEWLNKKSGETKNESWRKMWPCTYGFCYELKLPLN